MAYSAPASAATTRIVAPGAARKLDPCTGAHPCNYIWAIQNSLNSDVVAFEAGEYDYSPSNNNDLYVPVGVTLHPAAGITTKPVIKQTVGYTTCNCPMFGVDGTIDGLELDQAAGTSGHAAGAVDIGSGTVIHSRLVGLFEGMYDTRGGQLVDSTVTAENGPAVWDEAVGYTMTVDNVTAIAHGGSTAFAIEATANVSGTTTLNVTNTIARGDALDVLSNSSAGSTNVTLHYSDARAAMEKAEKSPGPGTATLTDIDHSMRGNPSFASTTDYTEAPGSPTIDAGTTVPASGSFDLLGRPRTVGPATDIGATEWQGAAPIVSPGAPTGVSTTAATIPGTVFAEDLSTTWYVNYGPTSAYGSRTPSQTLSAVTAAQNVAATLSGLTPGTTYHYQLVAVNSLGTTTGAAGTFTTPAATPPSTPPSATPPDTTPPTITGASLSPRSFAVAKAATAVSARKKRHHRHTPRGTTIRFTLSEAASVTLTVTKNLTGHRHGGRCLAGKPKKHAGRHARCTIVRTAGTLTRASEPAGADAIVFSGRIGTRALKPGSYTLRIDATDPAGNRARPHTLRFKIVRA